MDQGTRTVPSGGNTSKCGYCGGAAHSGSSQEIRSKECRAYSLICGQCGLKSHLAKVCRGKAKKASTATLTEVKEDVTETAEFNFYSLGLPTTNDDQQSETGAHRPPGPHGPPPPGPWTESRDSQSGLAAKLTAAGAGSNQPIKIPMLHMEFNYENGWMEAAPLPSPTLPVALTLHRPSYSSLRVQEPSTLPNSLLRPAVLRAVADTGAQMDILSLMTLKEMGLDPSTLVPVKARVVGAVRGSKLDIVGGVLLDVRAPAAPSGCHSSVRLFYVAANVTQCYLSLSCLHALEVVTTDFPTIGASAATCSLVKQERTEDSPSDTLPPCTNTGVLLPGDPPCSCPDRTLQPLTPASLPCAPTQENLPKFKEYLLNRYRSSAFNTCERQPLPLMKGSPPLELHVSPDSKPVACHVPSPVPLHWQEKVKAGLERDVRLGVLERVPLNTPVRWQSRMVVTPKQDGEPRRTVDYSPVNVHCPRQTHHTPSPWTLASSVPEGVRKSVFDNWHGYHSLQLASEQDRDITTFITQFGRFRYLTAPQGLKSSGDGFTDRMDRLFQDTERSRRCVDDTLIYDDTIEQQFHRSCEFLDRCASNGIILNPKKFQFAEKEVEFVGFTITETGIRPTKSFLNSIMSFPSPTSLTDIRSWHGMVAQISYTFSKCQVMAPIRHLLSSKVPFAWSPELESAFQASKLEIVRQCEEGVRSFNPALPTCLATDWCKFGIGYWLCQKRCSCPADGPLTAEDPGHRKDEESGKKVAVPGCCPTGWQTVYVGSRFCSQAEQSYAPIEGEALAASWGANKCRYFLLGLSDFTLALDHKPLIPIFGHKSLDLIINPRIMNQKIKLLPFRFTPVHIAGKKHVTPDCLSRRSDSPVPPLAPAPAIDTLDIANVGPGYSSELGPPSWVSGPGASLAHLTCSAPSDQELKEAEELEGMLTGLALSSMEALDCGVVLVHTAAGQAEVRAITWPRLQEAAAASPVYQLLLQLIRAGLPEEKAAWPEALAPYYPYRRHLIETDGVVLCGERPLLPPSLRPQALEILHAGHSGVTTMMARATQSLFWPSLRQDVLDLRAHCKECIYSAPSNPAPPPEAPVQPDFPFSHICMDFFQVEATYLAISDRYTNWLSVFRLPKDDSANVIAVLRRYFARWGVAQEVTSDGASVLCSAAMEQFLARWGVTHRISSSYYPRGNKRSELGVKAAKRLIMGNLGPKGTLDTDKFARALLEHRNTPDPLTGLSPAMVIFGREMKGFLPSEVAKYQPRKEWRLEADLREQAYAKRHSRMAERLTYGSRKLAPLVCGDTVVVQDQTQQGKAGKWTKTGEIVEVLPYDSYVVRIHGSRAPTQRNRRFLRKITPYLSLIPKELPLAASRPVTRATSQLETASTAPPPTAGPTSTPPPTGPPAVPATPPPTGPPAGPAVPNPALVPQPKMKTPIKPHAAYHRRGPVAAPGQDVITRLKQRELQGHHLAVTW